MKNVVLIGMPGCGKSTIGVILAKSLAYDFIDSDLLIQSKARKKLQEIISEDGIEEFTRIENEVNNSINVDNTVIATGGSAVYCTESMEHLASISTIVYLRTTLHELQKRISNFKSRGIVISEGVTFEEVYKERQALYNKYADITVDSDEGTAEEVVDRIVNLLEKYGKNQK